MFSKPLAKPAETAELKKRLIKDSAAATLGALGVSNQGVQILSKAISPRLHERIVRRDSRVGLAK
jgi:hypothetical protein